MVQNLRLRFVTRLHDGAFPSPREGVCKEVNFLPGSRGGKGKLAPVFAPAPGTDWLVRTTRLSRGQKARPGAVGCLQRWERQPEVALRLNALRRNALGPWLASPWGRMSTVSEGGKRSLCGSNWFIKSDESYA